VTGSSPALPFIVLAQARTGSSFLAQLLDSHPDIHCEGEVLNAGAHYYPKALLRVARHVPYPFLYWRWRRNRELVYGCKLMAYEVPALRPLLLKLVSRGWRIIHLEREDLIGAVLSDLLARKRGVWHRKSGRAAPDDTAALDVEEFRSFIRNRIWVRRRERDAIAGLPHLHLTYETDLLSAAALRRTGERMLEHLGLPVVSLSAGLVRVDARATDEVVTNLQELLDSLRGTRSEPLLDHFRTSRGAGG
jgi:hypothetical protein